MNNTKTTKRALLSSVLAMLICVAMLIGTTFAWFTDSASTAVNKIQAGTLDVDIEMFDGTNWVSAEGKTLQFKVNGSIPAVCTQILWEPGCTYELPKLRIVNNGNLALKYKIAITGINGDAELNRVIDWTIDGAPINLVEKHLAANTQDDAFVIKCHMQKSAGNEYQGLSIDGIGITVVATQDTVEADSFDNQYDVSAEYPIAVAANVKVGSDNKVTEEVTVESSEKVGPTNTPVAKVTIPVNATVVDDTNQLELTIDEVATPANFVANVGTDTKTFEIDMKGLDKVNNTELFKVEVFVGKGLGNFTLYHNGTAMTKKTSLSAVREDQQYYYNTNTGVVTFLTKTFSPFTSMYDKESWSNHAAASYATPVDEENKVVTIASAEELALFAKDVNGGKNYGGYTVNLTDNIDLSDYRWEPIMVGGTNWTGLNDSTIDGNNHTINGMFAYNDTSSGFISTNASALIIKNLTFDNATVSTKTNQRQSYAGVIMGKNYSPITLEKVIVRNSKVKNNWQCGGMIGFAEGNGPIFKQCSVEDCYFGGYNATAGTFFGLGIVDVTLENCYANNVQLYTDSLTWDSTAKNVGNFFVGHLYSKLLTTNNCTETAVTVVTQ